jgi:predicted aspartyl protease
MIVARLKTPHGIGRFFEFLIDSGADYSVISKADAHTLGIDLKVIHGEEVSIELADLHVLKTIKIHLLMTINGTELEVPVLIAEENVECLLGRKGIFDRFEIVFREKEQEVIFRNIEVQQSS